MIFVVSGRAALYKYVIIVLDKETGAGQEEGIEEKGMALKYIGDGWR